MASWHLDELPSVSSLNDPMKQFWHAIDLPKEDLTDIGHWSGTGIVDFGAE